jgi:hypothetical protein
MKKTLSSIGLLFIAAQVQAVEIAVPELHVHARTVEEQITVTDSKKRDAAILLAGNCSGLNAMYTYDEALSLGVQCN